MHVFHVTVPVTMMRKLMSHSSAEVSPRDNVSTLSSLTFVNDSVQPALVPSLFPRVPPTLNFVVSGQKGFDQHLPLTL